jgi:hypothetical protein
MDNGELAAGARQRNTRRVGLSDNRPRLPAIANRGRVDDNAGLYKSVAATATAVISKHGSIHLYDEPGVQGGAAEADHPA